jgi:hypothetical protein
MRLWQSIPWLFACRSGHLARRFSGPAFGTKPARPRAAGQLLIKLRVCQLFVLGCVEVSSVAGGNCESSRGVD